MLIRIIRIITMLIRILRIMRIKMLIRIIRIIMPSHTSMERRCRRALSKATLFVLCAHLVSETIGY